MIIALHIGFAGTVLLSHTHAHTHAHTHTHAHAHAHTHTHCVLSRDLAVSDIFIFVDYCCMSYQLSRTFILDAGLDNLHVAVIIKY